MIRAYPVLIDVLVTYHDRFKLLKNPVMRRTFARFATVRHAARVAGVNLTELVQLLNNSIGEKVSDEVSAGVDSSPQEGRPPAGIPIKAMIERERIKVTGLDVRSIIRSGGEPFNMVMQTAARVKQGEAMVLDAPFEPAPLYDVLRRKGFEYQTEVLDANHYRVWFYRTTNAGTMQPGHDVAERLREEDDTVYLDVRGLEPPGPMALVLETMAGLDPSKRLVVQHERVPVFLYRKLDERGYRHETKERGPHDVQIIIRK